jgi:hypothetical protein
MSQAGSVLFMIFQQAWVTMVALVVIIAALGGLAQVMKIVGGQMVGSPVWVGQAVVGVVGIVIIALVGFLAIPQIVRSVNSPDAVVGCGPIVEIGQFSALLIGAIGSLRMLKAVFVAVASASLGGSGGVSTALIEIAEIIFGMLLITVAAPVAAAFFGAC